MPVTVTPLGTWTHDGEPWPQYDLGSSTDIGEAAGGRVIYACLFWEGEAGISGGAIGGAAWEVLTQAAADDFGLWACGIARASPAGSGSQSFNFTSSGSLGKIAVQFLSVTGAAEAVVDADAVIIPNDDRDDFDLPLDVASGGVTLAMAALADGVDDNPLSGFDWKSVIGTTSPWRKMAVGYREDPASGASPVSYTPEGWAVRAAAAVSLAPGGAPEPIIVEVPATSYTLTLPAPSLLRHRVMQVPATSYSLTLPAPSILRHRILAVPLTTYSLTLPAPSLHHRQVVSVPLTAYALALPVPQMLTRRVIAVPLTSFTLTLPAPTLLRHLVMQVPVTDYALTLPVPALVQAGTIKVPLTEYALGLPTPQLLRHLTVDVPLTSFALSLPAPALIKGQSIAVPLTEYSLALPAPALLRHLLIEMPLTSYVLALPVPLIISPHSSRRRTAQPGDSATGGLFTIRAPGALVSDGITGGTIERG